MFRETKTYAFVGPSGTGKSYRAQMVANKYNIRYIIDDGILIKDSDIVAGSSAKKAATKVETVKKALFIHEEQRKEMVKALKRLHPESILILGTSDEMVKKIAANLKLPEIKQIIYINDVASDEEIEDARRSRIYEGKHVIPVPTFEIKKDFSGYLLDPLQIFKSKGKGEKPYISEKSIIRPTFSYMGNFTISDIVFKQLVEYLANKQEEVTRVLKTRVTNSDEGAVIYMEVEVIYGCNVMQTLKDFKQKAIREIENWTAMNVAKMDVIAKSIYYEEKKQD